MCTYTWGYTSELNVSVHLAERCLGAQTHCEKPEKTPHVLRVLDERRLHGRGIGRRIRRVRKRQYEGWVVECKLSSKYGLRTSDKPGLNERKPLTSRAQVSVYSCESYIPVFEQGSTLSCECTMEIMVQVAVVEMRRKGREAYRYNRLHRRVYFDYNPGKGREGTFG